MQIPDKIYPLAGVAQHYAWGGNSFIPSLVPGTAGNKPVAEYWLGAHDSAPSIVTIENKLFKLNQLIADSPKEILGKFVAEKFGKLPYLLKLLDVKEMLSIQVHPAKAAAEKEFARENAEGIPLDSPDRNYKDDNHKPELMVAMSEFWLLHGFKPEEKLLHILQTIPEFRLLQIVFDRFSYEGFYEMLMEMPQQEVNTILQPLLNRIIPLYQDGKLDRSQEDFWAARAALIFSQKEKIDRGIFSIYFLNLVQLKKGEGIFQDAGVPHAYLEGQNVEIMASSDNVLRGGLTNKHIDVKELLKHVKCEAGKIEILTGKKINENEMMFETPAPDFQLNIFHLAKGKQISFTANSAEILLLTDGHARLTDGDHVIELQRGEPSAIVFAGQKTTVSAVEDSTVFRASVPVHGVNK
jgi:mannose-6-phosphate isomerase